MNPLTLIVMLPLVLGCVGCACLGASNTPLRRKATALWAGAITATALAMLLAHSSAVLAGQVLLFQAQWMPAIGLNLNWRLDGLALLFATLILGMGLLIVLYAAYYLDSSDPAGKFFGQLMLFMAAMLGIVLADNLLLLVVFWELTSVSSFLLVGYWGQKAKGGAQARAGARMALAVTGGGGLALLGGVIVLGQIAGTHDISTLLTTPGLISRVQADARYPIALTLVLIGCFSKSAQWPLHFWLPQAMAAPTPVSAYLHGESGPVFAAALVPGDRRHRELSNRGRKRWPFHHGVRRFCGHLQTRSESFAGLQHGEPLGVGDVFDRSVYAHGYGCGAVSHHQPRLF
jgi:multicomponent K+:H+ antiporter subunit A